MADTRPDDYQIPEYCIYDTIICAGTCGGCEHGYFPEGDNMASDSINPDELRNVNPEPETEYHEGDLDKFFGCAPGLTGGLTPREYIEKVRGEKEPEPDRYGRPWSYNAGSGTLRDSKGNTKGLISTISVGKLIVSAVNAAYAAERAAKPATYVFDDESINEEWDIVQTAAALIDCPGFQECAQAMFYFDSSIAEACDRDCPVKDFIGAVKAYNKTVEGER
ncbi:MAG: hypothetical protein NUV49_02530 [Patescibacteria group bacterium]|nr:hypothetical protein [Patescibacteria group bacterium]